MCRRLSQNGYHNLMLDLTASFMPHLAEAAKGFGEGAKPNRPADELRRVLSEATDRVRRLIDETKAQADPAAIVPHPLFGTINWGTVVLLWYGHKVDHVRQAIFMRRLSHSFTDRSVALPPAADGSGTTGNPGKNDTDPRTPPTTGAESRRRSTARSVKKAKPGVKQSILFRVIMPKKVSIPSYLGYTKRLGRTGMQEGSRQT